MFSLAFYNFQIGLVKESIVSRPYNKWFKNLALCQEILFIIQSEFFRMLSLGVTCVFPTMSCWPFYFLNSSTSTVSHQRSRGISDYSIHLLQVLEMELKSND